MNKKTRVGVIGVGYLGRIHAMIYSRMPEVELIGIYDIDQATAATLAAELNCQPFTEINDLLDQVDAVSIVTPTSTHYEIAQPCIEKGVHIMMEKPIADSYETALALVEQVEKTDIVFQVGFLERFNAGVVRLADHVNKPRFIESHRLGMFTERATDVDVITDLMIHDIDLILSLVNSDIASISGSGMRVLTDHIDIANVRLAFENGAVANVTASRVSNKRFRQMRVFEPKHYYSLNFENQQLEMTTTKPSPDQQRDEIIIDKQQIEPEKPLDNELAAFIHSITNKQAPLVDGRTGLRAMKVADMVRSSIKDNTEE